ncbi:hypothetical protein BaRGS_00030130, partial [Batillaria attramentaria]
MEWYGEGKEVMFTHCSTSTAELTFAPLHLFLTHTETFLYTYLTRRWRPLH